MATARDKVVQYLRDARAAEYTLTTLLATNIAMTPEGEYRQRLESQRRRGREREFRLGDRLNELGARSNLGDLGTDALRALADQALALMLVPVQLARGSTGEERVLKNGRDLCAAAAVLTANYRALEQIAQASRDEVTAKLAVDLCSESDDVLSECFASLDRLAEGVILGEVAGERVYRVGRLQALRSVRLPQLRESLYRLRDEAADTLRSARRGATRLEVQTILPDYDNLPMDEICARLPHLSQSDQAIIEAYERSRRNRVPVLERLQELRGKEPWPGYDEMNVGEIRNRLRDADPDRSRQIVTYEREHRNRKSIIEASEARAEAG